MRHLYTSSSKLEGAWLSEDRPPYVRCRWWWEENERALHVMCGLEIRSWAPPPVGSDIARRLIDDFPEIAIDIARQV